ncbi:MAG: phage holin family protein [Candidatus Latescibacteria bacterium]|nr:phage holin family protein [Candidatus Latescibacterota bacterium]
MVYFLVRWASTSLAVLVATYFFTGIRADSPRTILVVALLLGIINAFVKPVLFIVAFPFYVLSLGLLTFVVNGLILWALGHFVHGFHIDGLWTAVKGAFVISLVSWCINMMVD